MLPRSLDHGDYGYFLPLPLDIPLEQALKAMLLEDEDNTYDAVVLLRARQRADPALLPLLYQIADQAACHVHTGSLLTAIEASGAPSSYFLDLPDKYPKAFGKPLDIEETLSVLGVRGDTLVAETIFGRYGGPGPDGRVSGGGATLGGVGTYVRMLRQDRELAELSTEEQALWLVGDVVRFTIPRHFRINRGLSDEIVSARAERFADYPIAANDDFETAWARRRLIALAAEAPEAVEAALPVVLDSFVAEAQTPPTPEENEVLLWAGVEWHAPSAAVLDLVRSVATEDVEATATAFELPAPHIPGPGGPPPSVPPTCDGLVATVYVSPGGLVVGGPDDGQPYAGTLRGTNADDVIVGTDGPDVLRGRQGDDTLCGLAGDDELRGDNGNDTLYGDLGDDRLLAGAGDDRAYGEAGNDYARGAAGADALWGGAGNDDLDGNADDDVLWGGDGDDTLEGGTEDDVLRGEGGTDEARGGAGTDACEAETELSCETNPADEDATDG